MTSTRIYTVLQSENGDHGERHIIEAGAETGTQIRYWFEGDQGDQYKETVTENVNAKELREWARYLELRCGYFKVAQIPLNNKPEHGSRA